MTRRETGARGEKLAREFLCKKGYRVLDTNYRCPGGELDIVATSRGSLVFIEVRSKTTSGYGSPEESITKAKQAKLRNLAAHYIQEHDGLPEEWRIDVVAVELDRSGKASRIELIENAVGGE